MQFTLKNIMELFEEKIIELMEEPDFQWGKEKIKFAVDKKGNPNVKLAIGNVPLDYDLWEGLRNQAAVGLFPAGLEKIWEYYASKGKKGIDESGRQTIFKIPLSYDFAEKNYSRVIIISVMLPFSLKVIKEYADIIFRKGKRSSHLFMKMYSDVNLMIDKAIDRAAIELVSEDNAVIRMNNDMVGKISKEAIPLIRQGESHGPCKGGNFPQKSLAVLMGLGQFGVSRNLLRDEIMNNIVERFMGPIRPIIIFDKEKLVKDGSGDMIYPDEEWRKFIFRLSDFTDTGKEINKSRFCTYIPGNGTGCKKCISQCISGALANSSPGVNGEYPERIIKQGHRFKDDKLQFDYGKCNEFRVKMAALFPEWSCARCVTVCVSEGNRKKEAVQEFYKKMFKSRKK